MLAVVSMVNTDTGTACVTCRLALRTEIVLLLVPNIESRTRTVLPSGRAAFVL